MFLTGISILILRMAALIHPMLLLSSLDHVGEFGCDLFRMICEKNLEGDGLRIKHSGLRTSWGDRRTV